jgi:MalT-like TPR region
VRIQLLGSLGWAIYLADGPNSAARESVETSLSMARTLGHEPTLIAALNCRALHALNENDQVAALSLLAEALSLCQKIEDRRQEMEVLYLTGMAELELSKAKDAFERSVSLAREIGSADEPVMAVGFLANIALIEGDLDRSCSLVAEALHLGRHLRWRTMWQVLDVAACVLIALDKAEQGLQVAGAAQATREVLGERPPGRRWNQIVEPHFRRAGDLIGQAAADQAWRFGRQRQHLEAIDFALGLLGHS